MCYINVVRVLPTVESVPNESRHSIAVVSLVTFTLMQISLETDQSRPHSTYLINEH